MKYLFAILFSISIISATSMGKIESISNAAISSCSDAVTLFITLLGIMCFWSGLMNIASKSGLTQKISNLFKPIIKFLFPDIKGDKKASEAISMNMTANLLGLGNAVTPLGIAAMNELDRLNGHSTEASVSMKMLTVLNTASIQLIPTTVIALRLAKGSQSPFSIMPAVWVTSFLSVCAGIAVIKAVHCKDTVKSTNKKKRTASL